MGKGPDGRSLLCPWNRKMMLLEQTASMRTENEVRETQVGVELINPRRGAPSPLGFLWSTAKYVYYRPLPGALSQPPPQTPHAPQICFTDQPAGLHCKLMATRWQQRASKSSPQATLGTGILPSPLRAG